MPQRIWFYRLQSVVVRVPTSNAYTNIEENDVSLTGTVGGSVLCCGPGNSAGEMSNENLFLMKSPLARIVRLRKLALPPFGRVLRLLGINQRQPSRL